MNERQGLDGTAMNQHDHDAMSNDATMREEIALRLMLEAMRSSQRAVAGLLALPASVALGVAATVSYAAAFVERGFQTFELSLSRLARDTQQLTEAARQRPLFGTSPDASEQLAKTVRS